MMAVLGAQDCAIISFTPSQTKKEIDTMNFETNSVAVHDMSMPMATVMMVGGVMLVTKTMVEPGMKLAMMVTQKD